MSQISPANDANERESFRILVNGEQRRRIVLRSNVGVGVSGVYQSWAGILIQNRLRSGRRDTACRGCFEVDCHRRFLPANPRIFALIRVIRGRNWEDDQLTSHNNPPCYCERRRASRPKLNTVRSGHNSSDSQAARLRETVRDGSAEPAVSMIFGCVGSPMP